MTSQASSQRATPPASVQGDALAPRQPSRFQKESPAGREAVIDEVSGIGAQGEAGNASLPVWVPDNPEGALLMEGKQNNRKSRHHQKQKTVYSEEVEISQTQTSWWEETRTRKVASFLHVLVFPAGSTLKAFASHSITVHKRALLPAAAGKWILADFGQTWRPDPLEAFPPSNWDPGERGTFTAQRWEQEASRADAAPVAKPGPFKPVEWSNNAVSEATEGRGGKIFQPTEWGLDGKGEPAPSNEIISERLHRQLNHWAQC